MIYIRVVWHHNVDEPTDPTELWYEVGKDQWAIRGFELFYDGSIFKLKSKGLSGQIPTLEELGNIRECDGYRISKQEFEEIWKKANECEFGP